MFPPSMISGNGTGDGTGDIVCENTSRLDGEPEVSMPAAVITGCDEADLTGLQAQINELQELLLNHRHDDDDEVDDD